MRFSALREPMARAARHPRTTLLGPIVLLLALMFGVPASLGWRPRPAALPAVALALLLCLAALWRRRRPADAFVGAVGVVGIGFGFGIFSAPGQWLPFSPSVVGRPSVFGAAVFTVFLAVGLGRRHPRRNQWPVTIVATATMLAMVVALSPATLPLVLWLFVLATLCAFGGSVVTWARHARPARPAPETPAPETPPPATPPQPATPPAPPPEPPARESLVSSFGHWPAVAAFVGLALYVPCYIAYEYFYASLGVTTDEVGLNYLSVLSRQTMWLVSSLPLVVGVAVTLVACAVTARRPYVTREALRSRNVVDVDDGELRRLSGLVATAVVLVVVRLVAYQVESVPVSETWNGAPTYPTTDSFFKARVDLVEVTWIEQTPAGVARRMLYLGQANGTAVFWDPVRQTSVRLPTGAVVLTTIASYPEIYRARVTDDATIMLAERWSGEGWFAVTVSGVSEAAAVPGCDTAAWVAAVRGVLPEESKVLLSPGNGDPHLYRLPGYTDVSVELAAAGVPVTSGAPAPIRAAAERARKAERAVPPPCPS